MATFIRFFASLLLANAVSRTWGQYTAAPDPNQAACMPAIDLMSSCVKKQIGYVTVTDSAEQAACVCYVAGSWNPNVFDNAYTACLTYFSTNAPSVYAQLTSDIGTTTFCGGMSGVTAVIPATTAVPAVTTDGAYQPNPTGAGATAVPTGPSGPANTHANPPPAGNPYGGTAGNVQPPAEPAAGSSSVVVAPVATPAAAAPVSNSNSTHASVNSFTTSRASNSSVPSRSASSTLSIATVSRAGAADLAKAGTFGVGMGSFLTFVMALFAL